MMNRRFIGPVNRALRFSHILAKMSFMPYLFRIAAYSSRLLQGWAGQAVRRRIFSHPSLFVPYGRLFALVVIRLLIGRSKLDYRSGLARSLEFWGSSHCCPL
jgi:hypothetical protein